MVSQSDIQALEVIIVDHAGPMGKFVVKKSIQDLGGDPATYDVQMQEKLITTILERAIFDQAKWPEVRRQIKSAWNG